MQNTIIVPTTSMLWHAVGRPMQPHHANEVILASGEILVEIELATICGSDLHTITGRRRVDSPQILGHEMVGRMIAMHPDAAQDNPMLAPGQRITWTINASCSECSPCQMGYPQKCEHSFKYGHEQWSPTALLSGGFASHIILRKGTTIIPVSEQIPATVIAPANCATATVAAAIAAVSRVTLIENSTVFVSGAGMLGLTATAMLTERGANVIISDINEDRLAQARQFGAVATLNTSGSPAENLRQLQRLARDYHLSPIGASIELSGAAAAVELAVATTDLGGAVALVGSVSPGSVTLEPQQIVRKLLNIIGVHNYTPTDLAAAISFLEQHWQHYPFDKLVSHKYPLTELDAAVVAAQDPALNRGRIAVHSEQTMQLLLNS